MAIIHKMTKKCAKTYIVFDEDHEDPWWIYVRTLEKKTGKQESRSIIIAKDLQTCINYFSGMGWILEK